MVCLSSNPVAASELLQKAARTAAQLNADWFAVHIETPAESVQKISTRDFRALLDNINMAADLGAEMVWLKSPDVVRALLDFAREKGVTKIMAGRTTPTLWNRFRGRSVTGKLLSTAQDIDIEVVALTAPGTSNDDAAFASQSNLEGHAGDARDRGCIRRACAPWRLPARRRDPRDLYRNYVSIEAARHMHESLMGSSLPPATEP